MRRYIIYVWSAFLLAPVIWGCSKDNYDAPDSHLYGKLIDAGTNKPVPSQTLNGALIKLIQLGYSSDEATPINSAIHPDGSYDNANLFSGKYKVIAQGPFYYTDTLTADVSGDTPLDIKVKAFLTVSATIGEVTSTSITVNYTVKNNNSGQKIARTAAMLGSTYWVDISNYLSGDYRKTNNVESKDNATIEATTYTAVFTGLAPNTEYFVRAGARTSTSDKNPSSFYNYTDVMKVKTATK